MQVVILKNRVARSALMLTMLSLGIIAAQASDSEGNDPDPTSNVVSPNNEKAIIDAPLDEKSGPTNLPETAELNSSNLNNILPQTQTLDLPKEAPEEFNPMETPEHRLIEELEHLKILPQEKPSIVMPDQQKSEESLPLSEDIKPKEQSYEEGHSVDEDNMTPASS